MVKLAVALTILTTSLEASVYTFEGFHFVQSPQTCESFLGDSWGWSKIRAHLRRWSAFFLFYANRKSSSILNIPSIKTHRISPPYDGWSTCQTKTFYEEKRRLRYIIDYIDGLQCVKKYLNGVLDIENQKNLSDPS